MSVEWDRLILGGNELKSSASGRRRSTHEKAKARKQIRAVEFGVAWSLSKWPRL